MAAVQQSFPCQRDGRVERHTWEVDLEAAHSLVDARHCSLKRLEKEARDMAAHLPRWVLTLSAGRERQVCGHCGGVLVFERGLRCAACGRARSLSQRRRDASLAWFGLLPPIGVDGLPRLRRRLASGAPPHHLVGQREDLGTYLLVPLVALYPETFPGSAPQVAYLPGFFRIPGMPPETAAHAYHMLGGGFMCLFAGGQWRRDMTCREVLQQRAYPHVIKMLNYCEGKKKAFAVVS